MYKRIRDLREDKDLTQQQLAKMLNITQTTYSRYETGVLDVPSVVLIKLSEFHNVSIDYILGQTDNPKRLND
ncbi:helix-turn-helix transcriptional regulator [Paenibacillus sp. FSL K6-1318]|uniref:helix-turn-helix domain-containing protein n=1 Tax=Paenibacillus sp. FSL K6-1318 TaxID=2975291 RepID=UPI0030ED664B